MTSMEFTPALHATGFIEAITRFGTERESKKNSSNEDYVGRITAIFAPMIPLSIPESKFISAQRELKKVLNELRGEN